MNITQLSSLLLFVQLDKKFLEESTKVRETYLLTIFGKKYMGKIQFPSKLASKLIAIYIAQIIPQLR